MRSARFTPHDIRTPFARKKVLTKPELLEACGCSAMTAWRLLQQHGYLTSYNHNARYYTLAETPQFDEQGLWIHRGIRFSKWGTLPQTILGLIEVSAAGMTAGEMEKLLHLPNLKPALSRLAAEGRVERGKVGGAFVYFARQEARREQQGKQREVAVAKSARRLPDTAQVIALLVEMVRHPQQTPRQWARRLSRRGIHLTTAEIQAVLAHYRLSVKKGLSSS